MRREYYENGDFTLCITRYKNEAKYQVNFINTIVGDFKNYPYKNIKGAESHLRFIAKHQKNPSNTYTVETGVGSKWTGGSIESKFVSIKIKPHGNYIVQVKEHFKPNICQT